MAASEEAVLGDGLAFLDDLKEDARRLVAESFERVEFPFGAVIVREGDTADAFYVLAAGAARVVTRADDGTEVPLNVLRPGDSFGEMALLDETTRKATVRASAPVVALRLDRAVFAALTRTHPQIRETFELLARRRLVSNFLRLDSVFASLPPAVLDRVVDDLVEEHVAAGAVVVREGDAAGAMYIVESGRLRASRHEDGRDHDVGYIRTGECVGERSLLRGEPRAATVTAVTDAKLLRLEPEHFERLLDDEPDFRRRIEECVAQYDFRRIARVPLDFAEEIVPTVVDAVGEAADWEPLRGAEAELADAVHAGPFTAAARQPRLPRRFPHVYQLDEADCGAACLAMICRAYGRAVAIAMIRELVHTSTDGTSLAGLVRGAKELGLDARAVRASKSRLDELPLPAVVHWRGNHWVVVHAVDDGGVRVADPAVGLRRVEREEFLEHWTGFTMLTAYTERFAEAPEGRASLAWLRPFFRPHRSALVAAVALAVAAAALQLVLPILTKLVVDRVLPRHDLALLWVVVAALAGVIVAITGGTLVQRYLLARVAVRVDTESLDFLTGRLLDLPMRYFTTRRAGDIERRLSGLRELRQFVVGSGVQALTALTQLVAAVVLMLVYSWVLALVYLGVMPLYAALLRFSSRRLRPMYASLEEAYGRYASQQIDAVKGIETVKALAAEPALRRLMLRQFEPLAQRLFRTQFLVLAYQAGVQLLGFVSLALFLVVGSVEVVHGSLSIGGFVSFSALVALANAPVLALLLLWDGLQRAGILVDRLADVVDQEPEQGADRAPLRRVTTLAGEIALRGVGFRYGGPESPPILDGLTLHARPGETLAVVGRSGSGKTTLVKLLAGLLEPTEGTILYDGIDLRTLDLRTLRRQIGFVLQESYLFDDTIARNIAFGAERPDLQRVGWAARAASAHEFIQRLPLGYDTRVGESGIQLSGGQRQRIAIARALYHRPPVLLLDEATSALDAESERAVKEAMDELLAERTSFVIAHRLSTIRDADRILVLDRGRLVEQGSHDELMARRGLYFYLASQQLEL